MKTTIRTALLERVPKRYEHSYQFL